MRKQTLNPKGFGLTGVLAIVVVLVVIGGAGIYVRFVLVLAGSRTGPA